MRSSGRLLTLLLLCLPLPPLSAQTSSYSEILPGTSICRELKPGAKDVFLISLGQERLLRFSIDKGDFALETALYDPAGTKLFEHVSHDFEIVDLSFPTALPGTYRIELHSLEPAPASRKYQLTIQPPTPVTKVNRKDSEARQAVARATTSLLQAVEQYDKATLIWRSISDFTSASNAALKSGDVYFLMSEYYEASKRYQKATTLARSDDWLSKAKALSRAVT